MPQDHTAVLTSADTGSALKRALEDAMQDILVDSRSELMPEDLDDRIADIPSLLELSIYREAAVGYKASFMAKPVAGKISCPKCQAALSTKSLDGSHSSHRLIPQKDHGGLNKPSESVVKICTVTEKLIQRMLFVSDQKLPQGPGVLEALAHAVLQEVGNGVFHSLEQHMLEMEPDNNHIFSVIKAVTCAYCNVRMHHLAKQYNIRIKGQFIRKTMTKVIFFSHQ